MLSSPCRTLDNFLISSLSNLLRTPSQHLKVPPIYLHRTLLQGQQQVHLSQACSHTSNNNSSNPWPTPLPSKPDHSLNSPHLTPLTLLMPHHRTTPLTLKLNHLQTRPSPTHSPNHQVVQQSTLSWPVEVEASLAGTTSWDPSRLLLQLLLVVEWCKEEVVEDTTAFRWGQTRSSRNSSRAMMMTFSQPRIIARCTKQRGISD